MQILHLQCAKLTMYDDKTKDCPLNKKIFLECHIHSHHELFSRGFKSRYLDQVLKIYMDFVCKLFSIAVEYK